MKAKTLIRCVEEVFRANVVDTFSKPEEPSKENYDFVNLHNHLKIPRTKEEVLEYLRMFCRRSQALSINWMGREESGIVSCEQIVAALKKHRPNRYDLIDKGCVTLVRDGISRIETILFRGQEIDRTAQGLDVTVIGDFEYGHNPDVTVDVAPSAIEILERYHGFGILNFVEHICSKDVRIIPKNKRTLMQKIFSRLGWLIDTYSDRRKREELFDVLDKADAVEGFNGFTVLWMAAQNAFSSEVIKEYHSKGREIPVIAGVDTHLGIKSVDRTGFNVAQLNRQLEGREIVEQLKDRVKGGVKLYQHYVGLFDFFKQLKMLEEERERVVTN